MTGVRPNQAASAPVPRTSASLNRGTTRAALRAVLAVLYIIAGGFHLAAPRPFLQIMPGWVPWPESVVLGTGVAELLGGVALLQPWSFRLRKAAGVAFALYAVCVFPANINHFAIDLARPGGGLGLGYHVPRMFAQPLLVWLALWSSAVIEWPLRSTVAPR